MAQQATPEDFIDNQEGAEELYERFAITIDKGQEPLRLDKFLVARIENATRNKVQKAIEAGRVLVNNKAVQPNYKIKPADEVVVYSDKEVVGEEIIPEAMPLNIAYEDTDILIIKGDNHVQFIRQNSFGHRCLGWYWWRYCQSPACGGCHRWPLRPQC